MGVFQSFLFTALAIGVASRFLDDVSSSDVNAVRIRLTEEKSKRLLLKNDVETLMLKVEELERKIRGNFCLFFSPESRMAAVWNFNLSENHIISFSFTFFKNVDTSLLRRLTSVRRQFDVMCPL